MRKARTDYNALHLQQTVDIPGWSKEDKIKLYTALREFGSTNMPGLTTYLQKSPTEIRQAIEIYKKRAKACKEKEKSKPIPVRPELRNIPLDNWARLIMKNSSPEQLQSETSNAIKLIAELESIPKPSFAENINFRSIYFILADAIEGKPLKVNTLAQYVIHRCILDTAYFSKNIAKRLNVKKVLDQALDSRLDKDDELYFPYTDDLETSMIRKLTTIDAYNPLNIPMDALKTTLAQETKLIKKGG